MSVPVSGGVIALAVTCLLAACGGDSSPGNATPSAGLRVVSSAPEWVSGGDARVAVKGSSSLLGEAQLRLNGEPVDLSGFELRNGALEGMVGGLQEGDNTLLVRHPDHGTLARLTLTNHPVAAPYTHLPPPTKTTL